MNRFKKIAAIATLMAFAGHSMAAGTPKWTWEAGKQSSNGAITVKSTNGSTSYSGTQNPTGAVAKTNQTAVTQPPTVIVQATSSMPVHTVGDACTASTSGTAPNQTADEGIAVSLDRTSILSCQSGMYATAGAASNVKYGGAYSYLNGYGCHVGNPFAGNACACPAGYSAIVTAVNYDWSQEMYMYECYKLITL